MWFHVLSHRLILSVIYLTIGQFLLIEVTSFTPYDFLITWIFALPWTNWVSKLLYQTFSVHLNIFCQTFFLFLTFMILPCLIAYILNKIHIYFMPYIFCTSWYFFWHFFLFQKCIYPFYLVYMYIFQIQFIYISSLFFHLDNKIITVT